MVALLSETDLPEPGLIEKLRSFVQNFGAFDISFIMRDLQGHIVIPERSTDFYRIMEEFASVPRSIRRTRCRPVHPGRMNLSSRSTR